MCLEDIRFQNQDDSVKITKMKKEFDSFQEYFESQCTFD